MRLERGTGERAGQRLPPALDRSSKVPLYLQIEEQVRRMLAGGAPSDARVFTEQELSRRFQVSRMTVRQAIRALVGEGLLYRVRGAGTFAGAPKMTESLESLRDNFEDWESQGHKVALRILAFDMEEAGADIARRLQVAPRSRVPHLLRLWRVDGTPIGLVDFYLHPSLAGRLTRPAVEHTHVRVAVAKAVRTSIRGERVEIEAGAASPAVAGHLAIEPKVPILIRRVTQFYGSGRPLVAANCYYRADLYRYALYVPAAGGASRPTVRVASRRPSSRPMAAGGHQGDA
jgi:GntR family transcriptional regulator